MHFRTSFFCCLILLAQFQCASEYSNGEKNFENGNYDAAEEYYRAVDSKSPDFLRARQRLTQIDSIADSETVRSSNKLVGEGMYSDAKARLFRIDSTSKMYDQARRLIIKIDSIELAAAINKKLIKSTETNRLIADAKELFTSLMAFKSKKQFHQSGFAENQGYDDWITRIQELKKQDQKDLLLRTGFAIGDLEQLALEYYKSKGKETEYSLWAKKLIAEGLKK